jgi:hypothetical protein
MSSTPGTTGHGRRGWIAVTPARSRLLWAPRPLSLRLDSGLRRSLGPSIRWRGSAASARSPSAVTPRQARRGSRGISTRRPSRSAGSSPFWIARVTVRTSTPKTGAACATVTTAERLVLRSSRFTAPPVHERGRRAAPALPFPSMVEGRPPDNVQFRCREHARPVDRSGLETRAPGLCYRRNPDAGSQQSRGLRSGAPVSSRGSSCRARPGRSRSYTRPSFSWWASSPSSLGQSRRVGATGTRTSTRRSTMSTAERPEDAARACSQARCLQVAEHHLGIGPRRRGVIGPPHHCTERAVCTPTSSPLYSSTYSRQ